MSTDTKLPCVYRIRNINSGTFYIGSTINFAKRRWEHTKHLQAGKHTSIMLQRSWNKHGRAAFVFEVLEEIADVTQLRFVEDTYLFQASNDPKCVNFLQSALDSPSNDVRVREKISTTLRQRFADTPWEHPRFGITHTPESRAKISANRKGKQAGEAHYRYGKTLSEEVRKKIGDAQRGVAKGPRSEETRRKLSEALKERFKDPAAHPWTGKKHTKEARAKMCKQVQVTHPDGRQEAFPSLTAVLEEFGLKMPTLRRALQWGAPISKGPRAGFRFEYLPLHPAPDAVTMP